MKSRRKLEPSESELHLSVANLLDWILLPPAFYTTFPAGWGVMTPMLAQRLKKSGLKPGMPDLLIFYDGRCYGMELKTRKNVLSPEQRETINKLFGAGVATYTCRSVDDVLHVLRTLQLPIRSTRSGDDKWRQSTSELPLVVTSGKRGGTAARAGDGNGTAPR